MTCSRQDQHGSCMEGKIMDTAKVNGVELEYEVEGSGEPVLLISNGPIADSFWPFKSEKVLAERYRGVLASAH